MSSLLAQAPWFYSKPTAYLPGRPGNRRDDFDVPTMLHKTLQRNLVEFIDVNERPHPDAPYDYPLDDAVTEGDVVLAKKLISHGAEVNATMLIAALYGGSVECTQLLLETNPKAVNEKNKFGDTPLFYALQKNPVNIGCVALLFKYGANFDAKDNENIEKRRKIYLQKNNRYRRTKWESIAGVFQPDYLDPYIWEKSVANVDECKQACDVRPNCELVYYEYPSQSKFTCSLGKRATSEEFPFPIFQNSGHPYNYTTYYKIPNDVPQKYTCIEGNANIDVYIDGEEAQRTMEEPECKSSVEAAGYQGYFFNPHATGTGGSCKFVNHTKFMENMMKYSNVWYPSELVSRLCYLSISKQE